MRPGRSRWIALLAFSAGMVVGGVAAPLRAAEDPPSSSGAVAADSTPDLGVASDARVVEALGLLEAWVEAERAYLDIPGLSMAVVHGGDVIWSRGFGLAHREGAVPATPDTLYSICSISKLFTSLGVMQLRDEGKLRLDEPIATYLPWFDLKQAYADSPAITLRGILTHSSGLPRESAQPYWTGPDFAFPSREAVMAGLRDQETLYPADRYFQYSNLGLTLAGEVVAAVSGQPYADYARDRVLEPLGMKSTTPWLPEAEQGKRLATGYGRRQREGERQPLPFFQTDAIAPAAGYASSALDLARFAAWQLRLLERGGKEVVAASTLREMQHVHWMDPDWKTSWGLGFAISRHQDNTLVGHGGACPGHRTEVTIVPGSRFGVAFLSNAIDAPTSRFTRGAFDLVAPALKPLDDEASKSRDGAAQPATAASAATSSTASTAAAAVTTARAGEATGAPPGSAGGPSTPPSFDAALYSGLYQSAWSEAVIVPWEGGLAMLGLPTDTPLQNLEKIKHVEGHTFRRLRKDGELGEAVVFELDAAGRVARVRRHGNAMEKAR